MILSQSLSLNIHRITMFTIMPRVLSERKLTILHRYNFVKLDRVF